MLGGSSGDKNFAKSLHLWFFYGAVINQPHPHRACYSVHPCKVCVYPAQVFHVPYTGSPIDVGWDAVAAWTHALLPVRQMETCPHTWTYLDVILSGSNGCVKLTSMVLPAWGFMEHLCAAHTGIRCSSPRVNEAFNSWAYLCNILQSMHTTENSQGTCKSIMGQNEKLEKLDNGLRSQCFNKRISIFFSILKITVIKK